MANVAPPLPENYHYKYRTWGTMFTNLKSSFLVHLHLKNETDLDALAVNMSAYSGEEFELDEEELASVEPYATFFTTGRVMVALATMLFYFRLLHFYMIHKARRIYSTTLELNTVDHVTSGKKRTELDRTFYGSIRACRNSDRKFSWSARWCVLCLI